MRNYKISFEQIRQSPELSAMLESLERGFQQFGIDYYLVGAVSRDVWLSGIHNIAPKRTTGDVDFAIFINEKGVYEKLKAYLIREEGFRDYHENAFVLIWKNGTEVDLLPFGAIEDENRKVTVQGTGYTSVHVDGFKEVYEQELPQVALGSHHFKFCSLPGIVLLKLIAWDDRPEKRRDDILDISHILSYFFDIYQEIIWEKHNDLFDEEDKSLSMIAVRVMGREIKKIAVRNEILFQRVLNILEQNTKDPADSHMAAIMVSYFNNTAEDNVSLIRELKRGLED